MSIKSNSKIIFTSFCIQKKRYCKVQMVYPEVCPLFKNNAIEHFWRKKSLCENRPEAKTPSHTG